jgi:AraC-like DNA-binding protein
LEKAARGLRWMNEGKLIRSIDELENQTEFDRILSLLSILKSLSQKESIQLASDSYQNVLSKKFESRINKVCTHLQLHFAESISLKQVADLVYMTESNFCKFFKKATSTTFSDYLNELRINEACHLLLSTEDNISKIANDSGFESLSYFNRVFLRKIKLTPSVFRNKG